MQEKGIWTLEITDDFEENEYRTTNLQNIHETHGKQVEKLLFGVKNEERHTEQRKIRRFAGLAERK